MTALGVHSEVGRLREVVLHRPGLELERLTPATVRELLFEDVRTIRRLEKDADEVFRSAISALFADAAIDAKVLIREKQILSGLEHAVDECDHVATTLSNLAVKLS